jgi:hypothetical protein
MTHNKMVQPCTLRTLGREKRGARNLKGKIARRKKRLDTVHQLTHIEGNYAVR